MNVYSWKTSKLFYHLQEIHTQSYALVHPLGVLVCFFVLVFRLSSKIKALQVAERELEQQKKQHHVAMDKLLLQTQSLEQALKSERHVVTEEK